MHHVPQLGLTALAVAGPVERVVRPHSATSPGVGFAWCSSLLGWAPYVPPSVVIGSSLSVCLRLKYQAVAADDVEILAPRKHSRLGREPGDLIDEVEVPGTFRGSKDDLQSLAVPTRWARYRLARHQGNDQVFRSGRIADY